MKTFFSYGQFCLSLAFCLSLTACNQDGFYEKELVQSPSTSESTDGELDVGTGGGLTSGSTHGGVHSGSNDGSTSGSYDGSTSGSTNGTSDGSTAGSTSGSSDGSTAGSTSGSSDGSTSGSTSGSSDGSTAGSTSGSSDGSTAGSTSGSYDGSTAGSTSGSNDGYTPVKHTENFSQATESTKKLDIVWIIDNSGSMSDEQAALGLNFSAFIDEFIEKKVDFKMAITTTDARSAYNGLMVPGSDTKLTSQAAATDSAQFKTDFKNMVNVGVNGSGSEQGLETTKGFMTRYSTSFLRPDAYLAVVIISDEEDQSPSAPADYAALLKTYKETAGLVKVYSIVDVNLTNSGSGIKTGFARYKEVSDSTAGTVADIRGDFHQTLSEMGDSIIKLLDSFALAHTPIVSSLRVYVNDSLVTNYTYDAASRSIKFNQNDLPPVGANIKVEYFK